jgi:pimeloyl-ACP methyl ester carboxylesterase
VAGLAIVNGFAWYRSRLRLWLARAGLPLLPKPLLAACRARLAPYSLFGSLREEAALRALCSGQPDFVSGGYERRLKMIAGLDLRPRLGEIRQPVALFAGDRDRIVAAVRLAREMQRALPDAELTVIEGGGHLVLPLASLPWEGWLAKLCERAGLTRGAASRGDDQDG